MLKMQQIGFGREARLAVRSWARTPGVAVIAILTLALGIGATTALFSVINAILLRSFGYADPARLIEISGLDQQRKPTGVSAADFVAFQHRARSFETLGASRFQS